MKANLGWKRNAPTTVNGESITLTTILSSMDKEEIDDVEKQMPKEHFFMGASSRKDNIKVVHVWKRNTPDTTAGYSITLDTTYSSFNKDEIDQLEKTMSKTIWNLGE